MKSTTDNDVALKLNFENLIQILDNQQTDLQKLDSGIISLSDSITSLQDKSLFLILSNDFFRNFLDKISQWILKNFSSQKLSSVINLLVSIFNKYNHKVEINKDGKTNIYKFIHII
jgi:hypothetical protein